MSLNRTLALAILATAFVASVPAAATAKIMKTAKDGGAKISGCKDCHTALPGTKDNLTPEGKKYVGKK